ncbi:MAG: NADH-ubiquinone oxidoreductase-F iron-sulfur binding region domain-containing protein [Gemmatimonadota bacterium]
MNGHPDGEIFHRWRAQPAPLLPVLHALHDRDGYLSEEALREVSRELDIPIADLFGTVTFYHHFAREPEGRNRPRVCTGPVCRLRGSDAILRALEGATPMPCPGRCDAPVPVLVGDGTRTATPEGALSEASSPLPPPAPEGVEECVFSSIREPGRGTEPGYRATGGYEGLERALASEPEAVLRSVEESGLAGRGGAGFPTGRKWRAVAEAPGEPKTIVCNADEGEPGCFKDRAILDHDPHAVIEGMVAAGYATGANRGFLYLRYEYPETLRILERALSEAESAGWLGEEIRGSGFGFRIHLRRGAGAYICGEETSLLNSLEGKHPFPRNRPPYPVTQGYEGLPTVINNVETLASVPHILRHGAEWYRSLGRGEHAGTKVISLSGDIVRPGNYEVPLGFPLRELLEEWAGGAPEGRTIQAVTMAGLSGGFLSAADLDVTLDEPSIRARGSFLGAGGIMVFDDRREMVEVARSAMEFFAEESCGKCFPCRIGTRRMVERLSGTGPAEPGDWVDEMTDLSETMKQTSACGLGMAAPLIVDSLLRGFPEQVSGRLGKGGPG